MSDSASEVWTRVHWTVAWVSLRQFVTMTIEHVDFNFYGHVCRLAEIQATLFTMEYN